MTTYINSLLIGDLVSADGNMDFSIVAPSGTKKTARLPPYMTGAKNEKLSVSVHSNTVTTTLKALQALLLNGEGVYWLRDTTINIYYGQGTVHTSANNTMGCWVCVDGVDYKKLNQAGGNDIGTIALSCTVALDGTGSSYAGPW